jgi:hemerythrin-like domain-containing protein
MLERSHRRLEERISELQRAAGAILRERADTGDLAAVDDVLAYLERSAVRHETDEEESLFPRLRVHRELRPLLAELSAEHDLHRQIVAHLRTQRSGWPPGGPDAGDGAALAMTTGELARAYRAHIEREERELLPAARDHLSRSELAAIRLEMERRRNGAQDRAPVQAGRRRPAGSTGPRLRQI